MSGFWDTRRALTTFQTIHPISRPSGMMSHRNNYDSLTFHEIEHGEWEPFDHDLSCFSRACSKAEANFAPRPASDSL